MQTISVPSDATLQGSVVTIGVFDGVHLGHRQLVAELCERARRLEVASVVVTFDRHPATVVRRESAPLLLTDNEQRLELLASTGVDYVAVVRFDETRSSETPEEFISEVLVEQLSARSVVVGHDFHFGHNRRGNVALLTEMGAEFGFDVLGLQLVSDPEESVPISSTRIRSLLRSGDVDEAAALLGRVFEVRGPVMHGDARGRTLGFPTANVGVSPEMVLPLDGVYSGWYERTTGERYRTAINVGRRPTFYESAPYSTVEAHLLDFDGDLYDEPAKVSFVRRLRGEEKFASVDDLIAQMGKDVAETRRLLA